MENERKENIQYTTAIGFLVSGIILCYISFFLNEYDINSGVLFYLGQAVIFCGSVFGLNIMIKNQVFQAETKIRKELEEEMRLKEAETDTDDI